MNLNIFKITILVFLANIVLFFMLVQNINLFNKSLNISFLTNLDDNKILVLYSYIEKNAFYVETLQYFIDFGVEKSKNIDYVFIIQGGNCSAKIPNFSNVKVIKRPNTCFSFGAFGKAIDQLGGKNFIEKYKFIIFLNPSVVGPILPKYWPENLHWTHVFASRLKENVHAVGTSIVCLPESDRGGLGPRIEGFAFAASSLAVSLTYDDRVFSCKKDKVDDILTGEYGFTKTLLKNGLNIDSLLLKYGKVDWRDRNNWVCNRKTHPSRLNAYEGISINPLEVVFHKPVWDAFGKVLPDVHLTEIKKYIRWSKLRSKSLTNHSSVDLI